MILLDSLQACRVQIMRAECYGVAKSLKMRGNISVEGTRSIVRRITLSLDGVETAAQGKRPGAEDQGQGKG